MTQIIKTRLQLRRFTAAEWTAANEVLLDQEPGIETDTATADGKYKFKIGDGATHWNDLPYFQAGGGVETIVAGSGVAVDSTDPKNPIVSSTLGSIALSGTTENYGDLPSSLGVGDDGKAYLNLDDELIYVWNGAAWPDNGNGIQLGGGGEKSIFLDADLVISGTTPVIAGSLSLPAGVYAFDFFMGSAPSNSTGRFSNRLIFDSPTATTIAQVTYGSPSSGPGFYHYLTSAMPMNLGSPGAAGPGLYPVFGTGAVVLTELTTITLTVAQIVASGTLTTRAGSFCRFKKLK